MQALVQAARRKNYVQKFTSRAPIVVHVTYAQVDYVDRHLYGIWALTKSGALCFNYWPDHLINHGTSKSDEYQQHSRTP